MNGDRYLFDTNAVIYFLRGETDLTPQLSKASWVGISIISFLEFLSFPKLTEADQSLFHSFVNRLTIVGLENIDDPLIEKAIEIRKTYKLKLPDAIIAATSIINDSILVSADRSFQIINDIQFYHPTMTK